MIFYEPLEMLGVDVRRQLRLVVLPLILERSKLLNWWLEGAGNAS